MNGVLILIIGAITRFIPGSGPTSEGLHSDMILGIGFPKSGYFMLFYAMLGGIYVFIKFKSSCGGRFCCRCRCGSCCM